MTTVEMIREPHKNDITFVDAGEGLVNRYVAKVDRKNSTFETTLGETFKYIVVK